MTTVFEEFGDGPRTHAFVIGVGEYPYCATFKGGGPLASVVRSFTPVKSPPRSARAVADWLVKHQTGNDFAPLGSVELLISGESDVDAPTRPHVKQAFHRWYERCDEREDNVALFFFSGHGCAKEDQLILLEDFGSSQYNPFDEALQVGVLHRGMERCKARVQCYFVDACRTVPNELLEVDSIHAYALIQPLLPRNPAEAPIYYATEPGALAQGAEAGPTPFTKALLQALEGGAAINTDGPWEVRTDLMARAMNAAVEWETGKWPGISVSGDHHGRTFRYVPGAPLVPFRLGCTPREALERASLTITSRTAEASRGPAPAIWEDETEAAIYTFNASFQGNSCEDHVSIYPPNRTFDLPVRGWGA